MLITYQYKCNPTTEQATTMEAWGELLRRHYNYALGQRLDWLPVSEVKSAVGIDVGLEKFLATSDKHAVKIPQFYRKSQHCPHCGLVIDRDWNSGINILNRVQRTLGLTESWLWRILGCESRETAILSREIGKPLLYGS